MRAIEIPPTRPKRISTALWLAVVLAGMSTSCRTPPADVAGAWDGKAKINVDGEWRITPVHMNLSHSSEAVAGTILWGDYERPVTSGSIEQLQLHLESVGENDTIVFDGVLREGEFGGRFSIRYQRDPEPYVGRFSLARPSRAGIADSAPSDGSGTSDPAEANAFRECLAQAENRRAYLENGIREVESKQDDLREGRIPVENEAHRQYLEGLHARQLAAFRAELEGLGQDCSAEATR